ncbi:LysR substrate-binding domain-containing protein [Flexivirga oryzae]|uniref:DNA-binding transcriptional LysR family regulator n=1 Tax=Flexivirga oryzae TaxID=1794944 RepID=A0A839N3V1_9MICO|nr:DNA-binding transcriptional LysR family regulator [Flexivirga oryzae]
MLDVRRLRLLVELSRRGTIAAVAHALAYSPSAVSQQLAVLEKESGSKLLEPIGRRVRLTPAGELLVVRGERILTELEQASIALEAATGSVGGTVRLAAFQSAALTVLPLALISLRQQHPSLRIEVTEMEPEQSLPALTAGDFDLVLAEEYPGRPRPHLAGVDRRDIIEDRLQLVVPEAGGVRRIDDVAGEEFAMEPVGTAAREWSETVCRAAGFEPMVTYTSTDLQIQLRMVDHSLAVALLPELADAARYSRVVAGPLPGDPVRRIFAATRAGGFDRPAVSAITETVSAVGQRATR